MRRQAPAGRGEVGLSLHSSSRGSLAPAPERPKSLAAKAAATKDALAEARAAQGELHRVGPHGVTLAQYRVGRTSLREARNRPDALMLGKFNAVPSVLTCGTTLWHLSFTAELEPETDYICFKHKLQLATSSRSQTLNRCPGSENPT